MNRDLMFSHSTVEWETPQEIFNSLDTIYHFTLDAAAADNNFKCEHHFTKEDDGLHKDWGGRRYG